MPVESWRYSEPADPGAKSFRKRAGRKGRYISPGSLLWLTLKPPSVVLDRILNRERMAYLLARI